MTDGNASTDLGRQEGEVGWQLGNGAKSAGPNGGEEGEAAFGLKPSHPSPKVHSRSSGYLRIGRVGPPVVHVGSRRN